jgi:hypothetical protein
MLNCSQTVQRIVIQTVTLISRGRVKVASASARCDRRSGW